MDESFGARLRRRRETQEIALPIIAAQTKISLSLLEGLERDDVSHWPSGIFRRAFIRAYAHAIDLDPDVVVREFLEVHPEPAVVVAPTGAIAALADGAGVSGGPPTRLRYMVGSAFGSLSRLRRRVTPEDLRITGPAAMLAVGDRIGVPAPVEPALERARHPSAQPGVIERNDDVAAAGLPVATGFPLREPAAPDVDFPAVARVCTEFGRVEDSAEVPPLLQEAAGILGAIGLIVWIWDAAAAELRPALVHGYPDRVLAQLPAVRRDADNATATAFRSCETCAIDGGAHTSGAIAVPLLTPGGCAGVLAIELQHGREQTTSVRAAATIFAAQLALLIGGTAAAEVPVAVSS
jgi:transcriptional regulator with XRE-family HTH domain